MKKSTKNERQVLRLMAEQVRSESEIAERLVAENPGLHPITAYIMASDQESANLFGARFLEGEATFAQAQALIGSYARFGWAVEQYQAGRVGADEFFAALPELWTGSDPDDTDLRFYAIWKEAHERNGGVVCDSDQHLPSGSFPIYRGQMPDAELGFSWSTSLDVARKFARGAGARVPQPGIVYQARVQAPAVLAYLTARGEDEVIVGPGMVRNLTNLGGV
jgi:hypothetical protein